MEELEELESKKLALEKQIQELDSNKKNATNRQNAVKAVTEILQKENIAKIYYIDDRFELDEIKNSFIGKMKEVKNSSIFPDSEMFSSINWSAPDPKFENDVSELWGNGTQKELYHSICQHIGDDDSSNIVPILEIQGDFDSLVQVYSPTQWQSKEVEILNTLDKNNKALFLFDYELINWTGTNGEKDGLDLAKKIIESEKSEFVYCGIFSHRFSVEEEDEKRREYATEKNLDPRFFYPISKKRYAYDPQLSGFAEGVKNVVSLRYIETLKEISVEILKKSVKESLEELKRLSPKTFNQIILKSAHIEGSWEVKELFRLFNIISDFNNHQTLTNKPTREKFDDAVSKIREIDLETGYNYSDKDENTVAIRKKELYSSEDITNQLNTPISNGDIFKVGGKQYILLVQPCNVSLRKTGRRNYNYNKVHLLPIVEKQINKVNSLTHQMLVSPDNFQTLKSFVNFSGFKIIDLDILDLAVFNVKGKCEIDLKEKQCINPLIQSHWRRRYEKLHKEFSKHEKAIKDFNNLCSTVTDKKILNSIKPYIKKPYCVKEFSIGLKEVYNSTERSFDFNIQRVNHYKQPYSTDLLQNFMSYLSRNAFDVDFVVTD